LNKHGKGREKNADIKSEYREEFTRESYKELQRLALWASNMGPEFYLIGGWAAWYYHRGLGSRDIDVVFPDRSILDSFLQIYYKQNGYESVVGLLNKRFRKRVCVGSKTVFVEIDAASMDEGPPFKEDPARNLPFSALTENHVEWDVGPARVRIPVPELLILMKVKAHRDRNWSLDHDAVSPIDIAYLRGKLWKDEFDILSLALRVSEWKRVWMLARKYKIDMLVKDTFRNIRLNPKE
jgi:hypothetical protein